MDAAKTIILETTLEGAPSNWTFLNYKDVDEYSKVSYVLKTTFKVAVFEDEFGVRHDYYVPKDPEDKRRPYANIIPGTHCTPDLYGELASDLYQLHIPIYRESIRHKIDKFQNCKNTDSNWLRAGCKLLMPIVELIKGRLLKLNSVLHIDETWTSFRIKIAGDGTKLGRYKKKYIWCVVNEAEKITYFFYDNDENDSRGLSEESAYPYLTAQVSVNVLPKLTASALETLRWIQKWERMDMEQLQHSQKGAPICCS